MKFNEGKILLLFSGILTGIVITSFLVNSSISPTSFMTYEQYENMSTQVNGLHHEIRGLRREMDNLSKKLRKYETSGQKDKSVVESLEYDLNNAKLIYGTTAVYGPGIKLTINDRHTTESYSSDIAFDITHNTDLLYIVNDLKNAGAEAISINNKRIVGSTSITCEGPVIMINGEYIVPPFKILAIGDPDALEYALNLPESHYKDLEIRKLFLRIEKSKKIKISPIDNINKIKYINLR